LQRYLLVAFGGALGAMLRFSIDEFAMRRFGPKFPVGTFFINISACFLIGFIVAYLNLHTTLSPAWRYAIPVGFIGAYSTFSTYEWQIWRDFSNRAYWSGASYLVASILFGLIAVSLGNRAASALP
jgi:CrcB protein